MFKIELTRVLGWDSPALAVLETMDGYLCDAELCDAEKFARQWLKRYQEENPESGASAYRILDTCGGGLKASTL
jgi:hypothetical protein